MSGYPSRSESEHDWIENSHASTALSYAHGLSTALRLRGENDRHVVAVLGDGSLTGGMAYEALNNLGHAGSRVVIVLNDNGRSYSPTISRLSAGLTNLRLSPSYIHARERIRKLLREIPALGALAYSGAHGLTIALREIVTPHRFFEALGIRYVGPVDGHDMTRLEADLARAAEWDGPILLHVLTQKGRGYPPAEDDDVQNLHDFKVPSASSRNDDGVAPVSYSDAFTRAMLDIAEQREDVFAITAAMAGPTGLLPFQARYPDRFLDVGHRRATRGHRGRRNGDGRAAAGRRRLLDVLLEGIRPGEPRRRASQAAGRLLLGPCRHHRRRRPEPPRGARPVALACRSRT